ncbi:TIR domain-containing protein [Nocardioides sp. NPDC051685]|uniref:TIR domain-containing protein n=1 Tax=Nocardioides sp. NPDC051685 TaxID=3364334 RepID=UPI0037A2BD4F
MDLARKIEVLDVQVTEANNGNPADFERWRTATEVALRTVMGADSPLLAQFEKVNYSPSVWYSGMDTSGYRPAGVKNVIAILEAAKRELALRAELEEVVETEETPEEKATAEERGRVFIVHGHDDAHKHELARVLQDLTSTTPIILHEQPSGGRTILEKLEAFAASAGFAVALLTADDLGRAKGAESESARARQNVVFEAGYFAGRLGRERVVMLHETGVELPSDLSGVVYVGLDAAGAWKMKLAHEMSNAGMTVDWGGLAGQ